jgi:hypothetical protein
MNSSDWRDWEIKFYTFSSPEFGTVISYFAQNRSRNGNTIILNPERRPTYVNNAIVFREFIDKHRADYPLT